MFMENYIFIMFGVILIFLFLAPFFTKRILNAGNISGILISILFICIGIYYNRLHKYLITFILEAILLCFILAIARLISSLCKKPAADATLIILGCKVHGARASLILEERLDAAYRYLEMHPKSVCVVSGGKGDDELISEAACMYQYLIEKGIDDSRIYLEDRSQNTRQNIFFSCDLIDRENLNPDFAIVSNEFHLYRALKIAGKRRKDVGGVPARTAWWLFPTYFVREQLCIINEFLKDIQ